MLQVTSWLFSPMSMKPRPSTTSPLPSAVTAPRRTSWPISTSATSPHPDGHAVLGRHDDVLDLLDVDRPADAVDEEHLAVLADVAAADVAVVLLDGLDHFVEGQAVLDEPGRVDADLILLLVAAPGVDLGGALHRPHLRLDDPIVDGAQVGGVVALAGHDVMEDLAQPGGHRPHLRAARCRCGSWTAAQPLVDHLPGEIDVGAVLEHDDHLRQAELRDGPDGLRAGAARSTPARPGR